MTKSRVAAWLAVLALAIGLASCASLPSMDGMGETPVAQKTPTVATGKGRMDKKKAA